MEKHYCPFTQPVIRQIAPATERSLAEFTATPFPCAKESCAIYMGSACALVRLSDSLEGIKNSLEARAADANATSKVASAILKDVAAIRENVESIDGTADSVWEFHSDDAATIGRIAENVDRITNEVADIRDDIRRAGGKK